VIDTKRYLLSTVVLILSLSGCQIAGVAAYKLAGPPKNPAKYTPAQTPMLVVVENYQQQTAASSQADMLERDLFAVLNDHGVAPMIPPEKLQEFRDAKPMEFPTMPLTRIAQGVQATQVLYVQLGGSESHPLVGGQGFQGRASANVKVVDGTSGETLWPAEAPGGYPVAVSTKIGIDASPSPMAVQQKLYIQLADEIARLFYKWSPEDMRPEGFTE
jgi:hypothetical protein